MTTTLRKALERLSAAALARDSTMGDPCALLAAKAELADANKAACAALAAPQPEPVAYVPRCHTDGNYCIVGEYKWDEIEEKPFGLADPAHWECAALYAAPPAAPAPAVPSDDAAEILAKRERATGSNFCLDNGAIAGRPCITTTAVPAGSLVLADAGRITLAIFDGAGVAVERDDFSSFSTGLVSFRILVAIDVAIAPAAAFAAASSIT